MNPETLANVGYGWQAGELARRMSAYMRECVTPEAARAFFEADEARDIEAILSHVRTPTLVLHRRLVPFPSIDSAKDVCAQIPDARLSVVEGAWTTKEGTEALGRAIDEFPAVGAEAEDAAKAKRKTGHVA